MKKDKNPRSKPNKTREISDYHQQVIDAYYNNGLNISKAVKEVRPHIRTPRIVGHAILKKAENQDYIQNKRDQIIVDSAIGPEEVLKELKTYAMSDATEYMGLTVDDIKELPAEVRRCIQSINYHEKEYTTRAGNLVKEKQLNVKLIDKMKAIDMINKYIGFYAEDNKQRQHKINLTKVDNATLNILLNAIDEG